MDALDAMIAPPKPEVTDTDETRGRPTLLKSYLIETNTPLADGYVFDHAIAEVENTGLDTIKILTMRTQLDQQKGAAAQFYMDVSNRRFLVLYTNYRAEETHAFVEKLTEAKSYEFDNAWLSTDTLKRVASAAGNKHYGFQVDYEDIFDKSDDADEITPQEDFRLETTGTISNKALRLLQQDPLVKRTMGYERITIARGTRGRGVLEEMTYNGRFSVVKGKSVDDHVILVDALKSEYARQVEEIEKRQIYGNAQTKTVDGTAFDFEFERKVEDWNHYLEVIFNAKAPFRLWGIRSSISGDLFRVLAIDMHTGHPIDFEVADQMIRVYLPRGSCGNVVLRLFVNLQRYFDSEIRCSAFG
jgi:hypothetical protein